VREVIEFECYLGSLDKLLFDNKQHFSEVEKFEFVKGIARGLLHLHNHNIIHRDLAAKNILLSETRVPKISVYFPFVIALSLSLFLSLSLYLSRLD
jgi:serine/threonine protein kinase